MAHSILNLAPRYSGRTTFTGKWSWSKMYILLSSQNKTNTHFPEDYCLPWKYPKMNVNLPRKGMGKSVIIYPKMWFSFFRFGAELYNATFHTFLQNLISFTYIFNIVTLHNFPHSAIITLCLHFRGISDQLFRKVHVDDNILCY